MNDLLRFLSKALHPFGYHIRARGGANFLRLPCLESFESVCSVRTASDHSCAKGKNGQTDTLVVYLRTCLRTGRNVDPRPRLTAAELEEHSLRCIHSLLQAIKYALWQEEKPEIALVVLDDRSSPSFKARLRVLLETCPCPVTFETTTESGQGESLHQQFSMARGRDSLVYFCEDDYLHEPDALIVLWRFYKTYSARTGSHMVLYPQEHHTLYANHYPSYIVQGEDRHWRSVAHATHTFFTHGQVVEKYWPYFENTKYVGDRKKRKKGSESKTTNRLFRHIPGFSPLKPCAVHLQFEEFLPPYYDWKPLWEKSALPDGVSVGAP